MTRARHLGAPSRPILAAGLLVPLAALAFSPIVVVDALWLGGQMFGGALGEDAVLALGGIASFLGAVIPISLLVVVPGVARGERRASVAALAWAVAATVVAFGPVREIGLSSWVPAGRLVVAAVAVAAVALLVSALRTPGAAAPAGRGSRLAAVALVAVFVAGALAGRMGDGIPTGPSSLLVGKLHGGERLTAEPLPGEPASPGRSLAAGQGSNIHHDADMSDAYFDRRALDPGDAEVESFRALGVCASVLFDRRGRLIAVCVSPTRVVAHLLDPATLRPLARRHVADRDVRPDFLTAFAGGGYAYLDREDRIGIPTGDGRILRFRVAEDAEGPGFEPVDETDVSATLASGEAINSALPDRSGLIWYVGTEGTVGVADPETGVSEALRFPDSDIENSFALAEDGGAYVVTSRELAFLETTDRGEPRVVWSTEYERGTRRKPGQTSRASGTTPTVMLGGRYVAITDNAEPRMHVQVYDTDPEAIERLVCETPVFEAGRSATENSLVAVGGAIFVENNYGYRLFDVLGGHAPEPGVARVDFDPEAGTCELAWESRQVRVPSLVSKVSAADGTFLTYTKEPYPTGVDAWWFTAVDTGTGEVLWRRLAGTGVLFNNHYAALYLGPTGNLYVGTVGGVVGLVGQAGPA